MALSTYAELQAAITKWLWDREDLSTVIPDFIALAEAQMVRELVKAGAVRRLVQRSTATIDGEYAAVPTDFYGVRSLKLDGENSLEFVDGDRMADLKSDGTPSGIPRYYSIVGGEFEFYPVPADSYTAFLTYLAKIPALSSTQTTNWMLTSHPDVYLYGALMQSAPYLDEDPRVVTWGSLFTKGLSDIIGAESFDSFGGAPTARRRTFG